MEFYKLVKDGNKYELEEENGQQGAVLSKEQLIFLAKVVSDFQVAPQDLPLTFRKYLTAYYENGMMEYIRLSEAEELYGKMNLDGFAMTFLEGEEENRVWIGADGVIENRGPSGEKVRTVLLLMVVALNGKDDKN